MLQGSRYLVTGGAGFIGSHIVVELLKRGKEVIVIDNMVNGDSIHPDTLFFDKDIVNVELPFLPEVDGIFHNAASKCLVCRDNPHVDLMVNAYGTLRMAFLARKRGIPIVYASTGSVLQGKPKTFYGASKLCGENYLHAMKEYDPTFKFVALRYHHVYGPRQHYGPPSGGVVPTFIMNILRGEPIEVHGTGQQQRHFTYVGDVVEANMIAMSSSPYWGKTYNFLNPQATTVMELALKLQDMMGVSDLQIQRGPKRAGDVDVFDYYNNFHVDFVPLEDGLGKTIEWYKKLQAVDEGVQGQEG